MPVPNNCIWQTENQEKIFFYHPDYIFNWIYLCQQLNIQFEERLHVNYHLMLTTGEKQQK